MEKPTKAISEVLEFLKNKHNLLIEIGQTDGNILDTNAKLIYELEKLQEGL